jgi:hypothetical protein
MKKRNRNRNRKRPGRTVERDKYEPPAEPEPPWQPMANATPDAPADDPLRMAQEAEPGFVGVFINDLYQVTYRDIGTVNPDQAADMPPTVAWLCIRRIDAAPIHDWRHLQNIKNDLCGPECEAIEIYPAESRLVDTSNQYHLWVMPKGTVIPFGYQTREVSDGSFGGNRQRPFADVPADLNTAPPAVDPETGKPRTIEVRGSKR